MTDMGAMAPDTGSASIVRLLAWLSPSFPVGGFAYSHGLEAAGEHGLVFDAASLHAWLAGLLRFGNGRTDAILLSCSHRAVTDSAFDELADVADLAAALIAAPELALESYGQGVAFRRTVREAWPHPGWAELGRYLPRDRLAYPVAVGVAAALHGVPRSDTTVAWLHACVANGVSAGLRLGLIGQTDGQRILAGLEPLVIGTARTALSSGCEDIGSACLTSDLMAFVHETQRTRLFRS